MGSEMCIRDSMTLLFSRFGKRAALMALMAIFTLGNLLSSLSPDYYTLLASRLVTGRLGENLPRRAGADHAGDAPGTG